MTDDTHQKNDESKKNTRRLTMTEETHLYLTNHNYKLITFKNGKTNQFFHDSNILHFYTR